MIISQEQYLRPTYQGPQRAVHGLLGLWVEPRVQYSGEIIECSWLGLLYA